ncbi:hypothetical protein, partial [Morganella morganii]|uniref:hypothetical protein n=1 Tax=Morganella morganii TaxID=582 RepID=UPI001954EE02
VRWSSIALAMGSVHISFPNIFHLLKREGKLYAVMSSFSDHSILQTWKELAKQNLYRDLTLE